MRNFKPIVFVVLCAVLFCGCENNNIFSWTHARGKDTSTDALLVDAQSALNDGDYDEAIKYYEEILAKDPDNSEALYGLAAAELKNAGLDIARLVSTFTGETSGTDSIIPTDLSLNSLLVATGRASNLLSEIANGMGDGTVPADDVDVNVNLALCKTISALANLLDTDGDEDIEDDEGDLIQIKDDFSISYDYDGDGDSDDDDIQAMQNDGVSVGLKEDIEAARQEIDDALGYFAVAAAGIGGDSNTVMDLKDDIGVTLDSALEDLYDQL